MILPEAKTIGVIVQVNRNAEFFTDRLPQWEVLQGGKKGAVQHKPFFHIQWSRGTKAYPFYVRDLQPGLVQCFFNGIKDAVDNDTFRVLSTGGYGIRISNHLTLTRDESA